MEVTALIGPSGTGKSHRALIVAHKNGIDTIIDDGLLIKGNKIIAGYSAKREKSRILAVKRAIFNQKNHACEVSEAIEKINPEKILILGTSENMINKITKILNIPPASRIIKIEDVATASEISKALESRVKDGKHIIPVPTIELKPHFSGYLIDPLAIFFKRPKSKQSGQLVEKSIVRPTFSYYGKLFVYEDAISAIVRHVSGKDASFDRIGRISVKNLNNNESGICISLDVIAKYGRIISDDAKEAQYYIKEMVEMMTGMLVREVNIFIKGIRV